MGNKALPKELGFLDSFEINSDIFHHASWLASDFKDQIWLCKFGKTETTINFGVVLDDGNLLTSPRHKKLLEAIKSYLCLQTHPYWTGSHLPAPRSERKAIAIATHVIDYFLIRSKNFKISSNGFSTVTEEDIFRLISIVASHKDFKAALYNVRDEVVLFLKSVPPVYNLETCEEPSGLLDINVERNLQLTDGELLRARRFLWQNGFYGHATRTRDKSGRNIRLNSKALLNAAFKGRVVGNLKFDDLPFNDLEIGLTFGWQNEYPPVPVNSADESEKASDEHLASYVRALKAMTLAENHGHKLIKSEALFALENRAFFKNLDTKQRGRFTTLPFDVSSKSLRDAIAFFMDNGKDLVHSYLTCVTMAIKQKKRLSQIEISTLIKPSIRALGVSRWRMSWPMPKEAPPQYFIRLRKSPGLYDLLQVLYGSIIIIINTLMARRIDELLALKGKVWWRGKEGYYLYLPLGKANIGNFRETISRPIPKIGVEAFELMAKLHEGLSRHGVDVKQHSVFAKPSTIGIGLSKASHNTFRNCLNRFCDFTETALDSSGRRYYIRVHQLRRNFAMLFFWQSGFGGIEVLRYFLGHIKPEHTYRYISESCPGKVLNQVKAEYVVDRISKDRQPMDSLSELLREKYGVSDFTLMPKKDVTDYIESLILEGRVAVEPVFIDLPRIEKSYKILVKVTGKNRG